MELKVSVQTEMMLFLAKKGLTKRRLSIFWEKAKGLEDKDVLELGLSELIKFWAIRGLWACGIIVGIVLFVMSRR